MSAISLILLCAAAGATALGGAALHTARGLRRQLTALRVQLETAPTAVPATAVAAAVPRARDAAAAAGHTCRHADGHGTDDAQPAAAFAQEIRAAVAAALADERERELAEARAFWAAQEARDASPETGAMLAGHGTEYEVAPDDLGDEFTEELGALLDTDPCGPFIPRQPGPEDGDMDIEVDVAPYGRADDERAAEDQRGTDDELGAAADASRTGDEDDSAEAESPGLAAARRRHPSQPDYNLNGEPVTPGAAPSPTTPTVTFHERTVERLAELADAGTPLADVRPGPLGTLDVYVFEDGTTVCLSPGHRATSEALADGIRRGEPPVLMGGSGIAGSYTLTFGFPDGRTTFLLADRVITPL
ncbi:hypothetical protein ITI46_01855 [Streptomyces oryzae]|uniref:Secreted protein n=1 Tax=Streptomyces oryzae TaxID=1434886 RepID=A0ABS3X515_9ACTN|nr:hypothetical protein [Streptomyces oryzae]MBO8190467.1 hypothetical protein [Streptomyces oryzae]